MAAPLTGDSEPYPTNSQETTSIFSEELFQPTLPLTQRLGKRRRNGSVSVTIPIANPEFAGLEAGSGRVTTKEVWRLIDSFKEIITHQTNVIESARAEILEIKTEQQTLKSQNAELQGGLHALREKLEPPTTASTRTWAAVVADANTQVQNTTVPPPQKEPNCVRISTQPTSNSNEDNSFARYLSTETANRHIRTALLNADSTKDVQVAGIGTTKTGYVIRLKDPQSAKMAQDNTDWLGELGNDTRLVKPRFGVVRHRTPTEDFDLDENKKQAVEDIMGDNDFPSKEYQIEDIAWLKRKDKPLGTSASLGI